MTSGEPRPESLRDEAKRRGVTPWAIRRERLCAMNVDQTAAIIEAELRRLCPQMSGPDSVARRVAAALVASHSRDDEK